MAIEIIDSEISDGGEGINAPESADIIMKRSKVHRNKKNIVIRDGKKKPPTKRKYKYSIGTLVVLLLIYLIFFRGWGLTGINLGIFSLGPSNSGSASSSGVTASTTSHCTGTFASDNFNNKQYDLDYPSNGNPCATSSTFNGEVYQRSASDTNAVTPTGTVGIYCGGSNGPTVCPLNHFTVSGFGTGIENASGSYDDMTNSTNTNNGLGVYQQ